MKTHITVEKAQEIVASVIEGRKKWGKQYVPNMVMDDVLDALVVVAEAGAIGGPTAAEHTKLKRQLAAALNREKARIPKTQSPPPPDTNKMPAGIQLDMFEVPDTESTSED